MKILAKRSEAVANKKTLSVLFSVVFLDNLCFAIVVPYLFFYVLALGGSTFIYGMLLASYSLMSFIFTPIIARFSDRIGRRKILLVALAVSSFSYFLFGAAQAVWILFLGRMLSGTTAATVPVAQAYVADVTTPNQRLRYLGLLGAAAGLAFIFGPAIGGTLSELFGYAIPSFLASILALANLISAFFLLPEPASFNIKRAALSFTSLFKVLKKRNFALLLSMYFLFFVSFVFLQATLSPWLLEVFGFGAFQTGLIFLLIGGVSIFTQAVLLPTLNKKLEKLKMAVYGIIAFASGLVLLAVFNNLLFLLIVIVLIAFGFGIQYVTFNTLISVNTPNDAQGGALGVAWAIAGLAQTISPVLAASIFSFGALYGFVGLVFAISALISTITIPLLLRFKKTNELLES
jgi:multidrug resistance protein